MEVPLCAFFTFYASLVNFQEHRTMFLVLKVYFLNILSLMDITKHTILDDVKKLVFCVVQKGQY